MLIGNYSADDLKLFHCQTDNGSLVVNKARFLDKLLNRNGFAIIQLIPANSSCTGPLDLTNILKINDPGHQIFSIRTRSLRIFSMVYRAVNWERVELDYAQPRIADLVAPNTNRGLYSKTKWEEAV